MNNSKNIGFGLLALVALIILPGCTKPSRKPLKKIQPIRSEQADYQQTQQDITVKAKLFSKAEYQSLLHKKKLNRFDKKTKALQISITNNSHTDLKLDPEYLGLELIPYKTMERQVTHSIWQGIGVATATAYIGASLASMVDGISKPTQVLLHLTSVGFFIASPIVGLKRTSNVEKLNTTNKIMLQKMMLTKPLVVKPGHTKTCILFVNKNYYESKFEMALINTKNPREKNYFSVEL